MSGTAAAPAALLAWMEVSEDDDEAFNSWYSFEHVPERLGIAGFEQCRRYRSLGSGHVTTYFTMYEVADVAVLTSPEYLERLDNPTALTRVTAPLGRLLSRGVLEQRHRWGPAWGIGGVAGVLPLAVSAQELIGTPECAQITEAVEGALGHSAALVAARLLANEPAAARSRDSTEEGALSAGDEELGGDLLVLEADSAAQLDHWFARLAEAKLSRPTVEAGWYQRYYQLMFARQTE